MHKSNQKLQCSQNHNQPIISVVLDPNLKNNERLLCQICLKSIDSHFRIIGLERAIELIDENKKKDKDDIESKILATKKKIEQFQSEVVSLQSLINQSINEIYRCNQEWIQNLLYLQKQINEEYNFFKELEYLSQQQQGKGYDQTNITNLQKVNNSWISKLLPKFELFQSFQQFPKGKQHLQNILDYDQCYLNPGQLQLRDNIPHNSSTQHAAESKQQIKQIKIRLIGETITQENQCFPISFDSKGEILFTYQKLQSLIQLQVWNFLNGKMKLASTFKTKEIDISGIVFSKKQNSFIGYSSFFYCWEYTKTNEWKQSIIIQSPQVPFFGMYAVHLPLPLIRCAELNNEESLLYCGDDLGKIQIWKVDFDHNEITYLENFGDNNLPITDLSLSSSENTLVTYSTSIHVWQKGISNQWSFKYTVIINQIFLKQLTTKILYSRCYLISDNFTYYNPVSIKQSGVQLKFISDDQFLCIPKDLDLLCVFDLENGSFKENQEKNLLLKNNRSQGSFSILQNKEKNVIIILGKVIIYIIEKLENGTFKIADRFSRNGSVLGGAMSKSGQYLVIGSTDKQALFSYEIQYN